MVWLCDQRNCWLNQTTRKNHGISGQQTPPNCSHDTHIYGTLWLISKSRARWKMLGKWKLWGKHHLRPRSGKTPSAQGAVHLRIPGWRSPVSCGSQLCCHVSRVGQSLRPATMTTPKNSYWSSCFCPFEPGVRCEIRTTGEWRSERSERLGGASMSQSLRSWNSELLQAHQICLRGETWANLQEAKNSSKLQGLTRKSLDSTCFSILKVRFPRSVDIFSI